MVGRDQEGKANDSILFLRQRVEYERQVACTCLVGDVCCGPQGLGTYMYNTCPSLRVINLLSMFACLISLDN